MTNKQNTVYKQVSCYQLQSKMKKACFLQSYNLFNVNLSGYCIYSYPSGSFEDAFIPILIFRLIADKLLHSSISISRGNVDFLIASFIGTPLDMKYVVRAIYSYAITFAFISSGSSDESPIKSKSFKISKGLNIFHIHRMHN